MIPFDFEYYRPDTVQEALTVFRQLDAENKNPMYYGGGSEIISMARLGNITAGAVIDLKAIPECNALEFAGDRLLLGSALTLSSISESRQFPLLGQTAGRIADHTMQCKITLGGNLASTIIYRETVLPLFLTNAAITIASGDSLKELKIDQVFHHGLNLSRGDFLVRAAVEKCWLSVPYIHVKKTKNEKVDYPLLTVAALKADGKIRCAVSGLYDYPFRDAKCEEIINNHTLSITERGEKAADILRPGMLNNSDSSSSFRKYVFQNTLINTLETLEGV